MLNNYLKIAARNLLKYKGHSLINIIGLAIGLASCILIALYIRYELSYDRFFSDGDRLFRVTMSLTVDGKLDRSASIEFPIAPLLRQFPEVKEAARLTNFSKYIMGHTPTIHYGDKSFYEDRFYFADSTLFGVLDLPLVLGDPQQALLAPNSVVITKSIAGKYFGSEPPLGKVLRFNNSIDLKVTGVLEAFPSPSHIDLDFLASMATLPPTGLPRANVNFPQNWILNWFFTYVVLENPEEAPALEQKLVAFAQKNYTELHLQNQVKLYVQPVRDIHLRTDFGIDVTPASDIRYVYVFGVIGALVLAIACFNFINLTIAQFSQRLRELGVRKVLGAFRRQLALQLLLEAVLLTALAGIAALFLVEWSQTIFRNLTGITVNAFHAWPYVFLFAPLLSIAAGIYPAIMFSSLQPTAAFKDSTRSFVKGAGLRKVLVVFQFSISVALIIGTLIVHEQLVFMRNKDTGFDRHQMLLVPVRGTRVESQYEAFKNRLLQNSNVVHVSGVNGKLGQETRYTTFQVEGIAKPQILTILRVELDFIKTFGLRLVAGRGFSKEIPTDAKEAFIINEAAMRQFGWSEALSKKLQLVTATGAPSGSIIGVVKDFHFLPLHKDIGPIVIYPGGFSYAAIKVRESRLPETLAFIEAAWKEFETDKGFAYSFLDDILQENYRTEDHVGRLTTYFSGLAIFIACLGLLGLAAFTAARRTKEIGIRKVLGASVTNLIGLLSQDFLRLVLIANLIAWPLAYFAMAKWLGNFAYRIDIAWWMFALAGGLALLIALLTVSTQAIKAAVANPVESLRYE